MSLKGEPGKSKQKKTKLVVVDDDFSLALRRPRREPKIFYNALKEEDEAQLELAIKLSLQAQRKERKKDRAGDHDQKKLKKKTDLVGEKKAQKKIKKRLSPSSGKEEKEPKKLKKKLSPSAGKEKGRTKWKKKQPPSVGEEKDRKKLKKKPPPSAEEEKDQKKLKRKVSPSVEEDNEQTSHKTAAQCNQLSSTETEKHSKKPTASAGMGRASPVKRKKTEYMVDVDKTLKGDIPSTSSFISYVLQKGSNNRDMDLVKQFEREESHEQFNIVASPTAAESESDWDNNA